MWLHRLSFRIEADEVAKQANLQQVALFMSVTESHSRKNINKSIDEAIEALSGVARVAKKDGFPADYICLSFSRVHMKMVSGTGNKWRASYQDR